MIHFFSKKFKTRVHHFSDCKYTIEWCNYRFIPIWYPLYFWFSQGHPDGTECWTIDLFDIKTAESIALQIKCKDDLKKYYKKDEEEEKKWRQDEKKYWEKNAPYNKKIINKVITTK